MDLTLTFDRTADVSKFEGCNTRGIDYRWDIFSRHLNAVKPSSKVLDFGAGSLRESFELVVRGFDVTSIDLDAETIDAYKSRYSWPSDAKHRTIVSPDTPSALASIENEKFSLITCFDVLEHLEDPSSAAASLRERLSNDGLMFITVPNGRTLFELAWRLDLKIAQATGRKLRPGEPHLQRNAPKKWREILEKSGLSIVDHEMHIGFFVNNSAALIQVPLALTARVFRKAGAGFDGIGLAGRIIDRVSPTMDALDRRSRFLRGLYGWNLFVCRARGFSKACSTS